MADDQIILKQFDSKQKRINKRLERLDELSKLLESKNKENIKQAQTKLKALGRYDGKAIDGIHGGGTTKALNAIRKEIRADQKALDAQITRYQNSVDANNKLTTKNKELNFKDAERKDSNALKQIGFTTGTFIVSGVATAKTLNAMNKLDAPAIQARNKELGRYVKEIDAIKADKTSLTKAKTLRAAAKRRVGAVAQKAHKAGVTTYKGPVGGKVSAALLVKAGLLKYAATKTENEVAKSAINAMGDGLILTSTAVPAWRGVTNKFGVNRLHGGHMAKIADAEAIGESAKPKKKAAEKVAQKVSVKQAAVKGVKTVGRGAAKAVPIVGWAATAYFVGEAIYNKFSETGSAAKAAVAGADELTFNVVSKAATDRKKSLEISKGINLRRSQIKEMRRNSRAKLRSAQGALRKSKIDMKAAPKRTAAKPVVRITPSRIKIKAHTRKQGGRSVRVKASYRTIR